MGPCLPFLLHLHYSKLLLLLCYLVSYLLWPKHVHSWDKQQILAHFKSELQNTLAKILVDSDRAVTWLRGAQKYIQYASTTTWTIPWPKLLWLLSLLFFFVLLYVISFMQCIYTYMPETNHVSMEYSVVDIPYLLFMVHIMLFAVLNILYFYISTSRSMCAVPNMAVFCSSLISCFAVCCSGIFWMILRQFHLPLLLLVWHLILHSTCAVFLL